MTFEERVAALDFLGLTPRQTRFVATVALHSGYCLRRQYAAFAGLAYGKNTRDFLDALVTAGVAVRESYELNRGHVYHLRAKAIYEAIHQEENRNRRATCPALVARKLQLLDFVIGRPDADWFATEQDKVALFLNRYQVPEASLPRRVYSSGDSNVSPTTRYFIHKQPIFLAGDPPVVHFVFAVQEGTGQAFKQFLWDHASLFSRVPDWAVVAICPVRRPGLSMCAATFARFVSGALRPVSSGRTEDLRWYFEMRRAVEARDRSALSVSKVARFAQVRRHFAGAPFDSLYAEWLTGGDAILEQAEEQGSAPILVAAGRLITHELPFSYRQFGALSGVA
jgi:hypothetical protein